MPSKSSRDKQLVPSMRSRDKQLVPGKSSRDKQLVPGMRRGRKPNRKCWLSRKPVELWFQWRIVLGRSDISFCSVFLKNGLL